MTPNTDAIHQMCSDIPVSAEDAAGLQEAAERLKRRDQSGSEEISRYDVDYTLTISKPDADGHILVTSNEVPGLVLYGPPARVLGDVPLAVYTLDEHNGRRRQEELSRDLIEQARSEAVGG